LVSAVPTTGRASHVECDAPPEAVATRALYERYANQIFSYCLHQLGSREDAEDAVQSTFLNAFRGLKRGVVPHIEQAWLFKIAHNVCLSRRRSSWRRSRIESPADFERAEQTTAAPTRRAEELIGLQDALEVMPESQRRAILLREWQGLSYREIGEELELSQAAVETLIFRARRTLAQHLEKAPAETRPQRRRARASLDLGALIGSLKSLFAGGAAVKVASAAAVVAVTATAVGVTESTRTPAKSAKASGARVTASSTRRVQAQAPSLRLASKVGGSTTRKLKLEAARSRLLRTGGLPVGVADRGAAPVAPSTAETPKAFAPAGTETSPETAAEASIGSSSDGRRATNQATAKGRGQRQAGGSSSQSSNARSSRGNEDSRAADRASSPASEKSAGGPADTAKGGSKGGQAPAEGTPGPATSGAAVGDGQAKPAGENPPKVDPGPGDQSSNGAGNEPNGNGGGSEAKGQANPGN
jgi:RNA polymerase sigma factor (sigma-70 family)